MEDFNWENPFILWVANLKNVKHPEIFIDLAKQFIGSTYGNKKLDFILFGEIQNDKYAYVKNQKNLPPNCYYLGKQNNKIVNDAIKKSLFLVHTCDPEGMPNIFLQAWSAGKLTISLNYDPDDMITQNNVGFYTKTVDKLIESVKIVINDYERKKQLENNALKLSKIFNTKSNIEKLEQVIINIYLDKSYNNKMEIK